jgi:hypothetical protein
MVKRLKTFVGRLLQSHITKIWILNYTLSIPDGVTGIFHWHNLPGRTMILGLTQPLTGIFGGGSKVGRCVGLTILPPSYADCLEAVKASRQSASVPVQPGNKIVLHSCEYHKFHLLLWSLFLSVPLPITVVLVGQNLCNAFCPTTSSPSILSRVLILQPWREECIYLRHLDVSLQDHMKSKTRNYADDNFDRNGRLITNFHHLQQIISLCTERPSHVSYNSP